jgi:hypothetical protein
MNEARPLNALEDDLKNLCEDLALETADVDWNNSEYRPFWGNLKVAEGFMRNALKLVQQCTAFLDNKE